jgi:putative NADPH-quinone reductase
MTEDHTTIRDDGAFSGARRRILILFAHPSYGRSEVNRPMFEAARELEDVTAVDLYAEYPDLRIDVDTEQQRLREHQVIVFQHPLYWYSTPAILKQWQDLVLEYGFAYGHDGTELHGKIFFDATTAGGLENAYRDEGYNHFTIGDLLHPIEQTANLCGMRYLPPFALFGARKAVDEGRCSEHVADWVRLLEALRDRRLDLNRARTLTKLNDDLDAIIREAE